MKKEILESLDTPRQLEKLYRENKAAFKKSFEQLYQEREKTALMEAWHERLNYEQEEISWGSEKELLFVVLLVFLAGLVAKIPDFFNIDQEYFYPRNLGFIVFPFLTAYFAWKQNAPQKIVVGVFAFTAVLAAYINFLPDDSRSDTLILAGIHLPLLLWTLMGAVFVGGDLQNYSRRLDFLRCNGDQVVMTAIILLSGGLMSAATVGLFGLIGLNIEDFYFKYIGIFGLAGAPVVATYLVRTNPQLVNRVSPVIAKVFTPLVLVMLSVYLVAVIYTGKDPYNDREFLLVFNLLLVGVMAIILFAVAETSKGRSGRIGNTMLLALSVVTIIVNGIALSAILFRIAEWGITPNRLAVLGSNVLILTHLVMVAFSLLKVVRQKSEIDQVRKSITWFLPVYSVWTAFVVFVFPVLFNFK